MDAWNQGAVVSVKASGLDPVLGALRKIANMTPSELNDALQPIRNVENEKWDWALPDDVKLSAYASLRLDMQGAVEMAQRLVSEN
jgi:ATP-dependent helicase Lhr and Lhr-like helicase